MFYLFTSDPRATTTLSKVACFVGPSGGQTLEQKSFQKMRYLAPKRQFVVAEFIMPKGLYFDDFNID